MAKYLQPNFIVDSSASFLKNTTFNGLTAFDSSIRFGGVTYSSFGTMAVESSANYYNSSQVDELIIDISTSIQSVDSSITALKLKDTQIDASIARIDASLNDVVDITVILDASFNELYATNAAQDASITALKLKDTQIDASIVRIDASIASLITNTVTASNGLTITDNVVELGGIYNKDISINSIDNKLLFSNKLSSVNITSYTDKILKLDNGYIYVAISYNTFNGESCFYGLNRVYSDFKIDKTFNGGIINDGDNIDNIFYDNYSNKLILVGYFTEYNGVTTSSTGYSVIRINLDGTLDTSFSLNLDNEILSFLVLNDGKYMISGYFAEINSIPYSNVAVLNSDGSLNQTTLIGSGFSNYFNSMKQDSNGKIILAGYLGNYNGVAHKTVVRLNSDFTLDNSFVFSLTSFMNEIIITSDNKYLLSTRSGSPSVMKVNYNGSDDQLFYFPYTSIMNSVKYLSEDSDGYLIGGSIYNEENTHQHLFVKIDKTYGTLLNDFIVPTEIQYSVHNNFLIFDQLYIISYSCYDGINNGYHIHTFKKNGEFFNETVNFDLVKNKTIDYGADYSLYYNDRSLVDKGYTSTLPFFKKGGTTKEEVNWEIEDNLKFETNNNIWEIGSGINGYIYTLKSDGDDLIIGGSINDYNGNAVYNIVKIKSDGSIDESFNIGTGANNEVFDILVEDNTYLIAGFFTDINGTSCTFIKRIFKDGSIDTSFNATIGAGSAYNVNALYKTSDNKYLIGGKFKVYNGTTINTGSSGYSVIRINLDGTLDTSFNIGTGFASTIYYGKSFFPMFEDSNGKYLIGGSFSSYKGVSSNNIIRLNNDGSRDESFDIGTGFNNTVHSISEVSNNRYIVGGRFTTYKGVNQKLLVHLNNDGTIYNSFSQGSNFTSNNSFLRSIKILPANDMILTGYFAYTQDNINYNKIIKLSIDGSIYTNFKSDDFLNSENITHLEIINNKLYCGGGIGFYTYNDGSKKYYKGLFPLDLSTNNILTYSKNGIHLDYTLKYNDDYSSLYTDRSLVDKGYVDGKIGSSDSSIAALILKDTQIDASIVRIDLTNAAQDASITALKLKDTQIDASIARIDASLNDVVDITTILDASFNEIYIINSAQDASITALKLKDTQIDASISRIDASIASLLSGTVESWNGLTKTDNSIGLGGKLIQDTIIHGDNSLSLVLGANYTSDVSQLYNFTVGASTIDFYAKSFKLMPQEGGFPDFSLDPDEIRLGSSSGANKGRLTLCRTDGQLTTYGSSGAPILMSSPTQLTTYGSSGAPILMSSPTNLSYLFDGVTSFTYSSTQGLYIPSPNKIDLRTSGSGTMTFSANGSGGINFFNSDSSSSGVTSFYGKNIPSSSFNLYQFKKFNYVSSLNGLTIDNSVFKLYNNYFSLIQDTSGKFITATFKEANPNGLVYAADYSANYINRSLVDKAYVDSKAASSSIAWNGLTKTVDGSIGLGGILAQDSNIITNDKILSVTGNLTVTGNLVVDGSITSVNSVNLNVSDNIITINAGQTGSGVSRGYAGLLVDRGTADPYVFVFEESSDTFRIGIGTEGGLPTGTQAVSTRQDVPIAAGIAYWNNSQNRFDTVSGFTYDASGLGLGTVIASTTEATALLFDGVHVVSRELGTNAFTSTAYATDASISALTNRLNTTDASVALLQTKDTQIDASIVRIDASIASLVTKGASVYKGTFDGTAGTTTTITAATHELGVGPLSISVYDGVEQVYTDVECAANGDITLTWGAGTLTASCKYVIIG